MPFTPGQKVIIKPHTTHNFHSDGKDATVVRMMAGDKYVILSVPHWQVRAKVEDLEIA